MTIDECLNELRKDKDWYVVLQRKDAANILKRFGMELISECVGEEKKGDVSNDDLDIGFNTCRTSTLESAKKILGV